MNAIIYAKEGYSPDQINHFSQKSMGIDPDSHIDSVIQAITESARTGDEGEEGDGIIFVSTVDQAIDIGSSNNRKVGMSLVVDMI